MANRFQHPVTGPTYVSFWKELQGVPFTQGYADAGGVRTRYLHCGDPGHPAVIMLHGFMSHADVFIRNLRAHGEHFSTYAIDLMGMGYSDKPDYAYHAPVVAKQVADFMDAVGIKSCALLGTSFGSRVAARFAIDYPNRLDKLTLVSPAGLRVDIERSKRLINDHLHKHDESTWAGADAAMRLICADEFMFDDVIAARMQAQSQPGIREAYPHVAVHHMPETMHLSLVNEAAYRSIRCPALIVKGVMDVDTSTSLAREIADLIPNGRLVFIQRSKHAPYLERPDEFNRIHLDFLLNA